MKKLTWIVLILITSLNYNVVADALLHTDTYSLVEIFDKYCVQHRKDLHKANNLLKKDGARDILNTITDGVKVSNNYHLVYLTHHYHIEIEYDKYCRVSNLFIDLNEIDNVIMDKYETKLLDHKTDYLSFKKTYSITLSNDVVRIRFNAELEKPFMLGALEYNLGDNK
jgi:hypothetical protein